MGKPWLTANHVTFARILSMPLMVWLFYQGRTGQWWAFGIGGVIATTDFVDGYLARKYGPTVLGGLMDPIADKLFVAVIFLPLVHLGWIPAWPVAVIFVRETLITGLRTAYAVRDISLKTSYIAKVKTWIQMQGAATIIFLGLVQDRQLVWSIMLPATALPLVALFGFLAIKRRFYRGAAIMFGMMALLDLMYLPNDIEVTLYLVTLGILVATWGSGLDYLVGGLRQMKGRADFGRSDAVRVLSGIAVPLLVVAVLIETGAPMWAPIAVLCVELAVGGLDNLLAHHGASSGAVAWSLRSFGAAGLLSAMLLAHHYGQPDYITPLAITAVAISVLGCAREFWRGREYYL